MPVNFMKGPGPKRLSIRDFHRNADLRAYTFWAEFVHDPDWGNEVPFSPSDNFNLCEVSPKHIVCLKCKKGSTWTEDLVPRVNHFRWTHVWCPHCQGAGDIALMTTHPHNNRPDQVLMTWSPEQEKITIGLWGSWWDKQHRKIPLRTRKEARKTYRTFLLMWGIKFVGGGSWKSGDWEVFDAREFCGCQVELLDFNAEFEFWRVNAEQRWSDYEHGFSPSREWLERCPFCTW